MTDHPWNLVFLIGFIVYVAIRDVFIERTKRVEKTVRRVDGLERALMFCVFVGTMGLPLLCSGRCSRSRTITCPRPRGGSGPE